MRIKLLFVGRTDAGPVASLVDHYLERLRPYAQMEVIEVAESRARDVEQRRTEEAARILKTLKPGETVVLTDEAGREFTSPGFAKELGCLRDGGTHRLVVVVGGAHGVTDEVRAKARLVLSLSPMTFTHQLVRVVLVEQLYRAFTILHGRGYHH